MIGYSLPRYDQLVRSLLLEAIAPNTTIHVFDPDPAVAPRFRELLKLDVRSYPGLPDGIDEIAGVLKRSSDGPGAQIVASLNVAAAVVVVRDGHC